jgi:hypothetical protein
MAVPKLYATSPAAAKQAAANISKDIQMPEDPYPVNHSVQSGKDGAIDITHDRWAETGVVERAYLDVDKKGKTVFVVGVKVRDGNPNQHKFAWGRVTKDYDDPPSFRDQLADQFLVSLFKTTGLGNPDVDGLPLELLSMCFPIKTAATSTPLRGKEVLMNFHRRSDTNDADKFWIQIDTFSAPPATE